MMIQQSPSVFVELAVNVAMIFGSPNPGNVFQPVDRVDSRPIKTRTLSTSTGRLNRRKALDWTINLAKLRRLTILRT